MDDTIISWLSPKPPATPSPDYYQAKNNRLLVGYALTIATAVMFFVIFDFAGGKQISGGINLAYWLVLVGLMLAYRLGAAFVPTTILVVTSCQMLLGIQHLFAPDGLIANFFWPPLLTMVSVHVLGRRSGIKLGLASSSIVVIAGILRPILNLEGDAFSGEEIFRFHLISLAFSVSVGTYIAGRLSSEVDVVFQRLEARRNELFDLYETNSALLSMLGHDLNNHLTPLTMQVLGLSALLPEGTGKVLLAIEKRIEMIGKLVAQTNEFTALRSGKLHIRLGPVDLNRALTESLSLFNSEFAERNIVVVEDLPRDKTPLVITAERYSLVTNVLSNALSNAIKFSPDGSKIDITVEPDASTVCLRLADRGAGIPNDLLPHLFDFRTPTTRQGVRGEKGTGFGLPILKMFMERYGGSVEISSGRTHTGESPASNGTTVSLTFQRAQDSQNEVQGATKSRP